jgi:hypothetical protein
MRYPYEIEILAQAKLWELLPKANKANLLYSKQTLVASAAQAKL